MSRGSGEAFDATGVERAVRQGEERFADFAENFAKNLEVVLWVADPRGPRALYVSPAFERLWQRSPSDVYAHFGTWMDAIHPDDQPHVRRLFYASAAAGEYEMEYRVVRPDGSVIWIRDRCFPIRDELGQLVRVTGIAEDITARKATERVLSQWGDAFKYCAHGLAMGDAISDGVILCNPALASLLGRSPEQVAGMPVLRLYASSEHERVREQTLLADREGHARYESLMCKADESTVPVQVDLVSVRDEQGKILYRIATVQDIADRKLAEQRLRTLSAHLESAMEAASLGVWVWDPRKGTLWGNENQRRLWGLDGSVPESFPTHVLGGMIDEPDRRLLADTVKRTLVEGRNFAAEFRIQRPDGRTRWIASRARPEKDEQGQPVKLVGVNIDITDQKLASEAIMRSQKLEALGTLSGGIAHDFNNILQAVLGHAELGLARLPPDHPSRASLMEISSAAARAADLVHQILSFSRPQEHRRRSIRLAPVLHEALQLLRATLPASIAFHVEIADASDAVNADPTQVHQILVNLIANAAYAIGRAPGLIDIRLTPLTLDHDMQGVLGLAPGAYVRVSVRDNGPGMDKETLARAFDPFFTTKPPGEGTGLGLSVVHGIMRGLGGAVDAYSEQGEGAEFHLYFPAELEDEHSEEVPALGPRGNGELILFVDDEFALAALGRQVLENFGYVVHAFSDPVRALEAFRSAARPYAAVITDLTMPAMNGFELARAVLAARPDVPVLLISGYAGPEEHRRAASVGIREVLSKPLTMELLTTRLHAALHPDGRQQSAER